MVGARDVATVAPFAVTAQTSWGWGGAAVRHPAEVEVRGGERLQMSVSAHYFADPAPTQPRGGLDHLWDYEVVELFLAYTGRPDGLRYLEVELGPHGHWICLAFDGVRQPRCCPIPTSSSARIDGRRWTAQLTLPGDWAVGASAYNVCAIHGQGDTRRYESAVSLPGETPDFHQPRHFRAIG